MKQYLSIYILTIVFLFSCTSSVAPSKHLDCSSTDIELIDSCLLGKTLQSAINKLQVNTTQFYAIDEPAGILRGINVQLSDSCEIFLLIEPTSIINKTDSMTLREEYLHIVDKEVISVWWVKPKLKKENYIKIDNSNL